MSRFAENIRPYVDAELRAADDAERSGDAARAFTHLERAHVLGQASTAQHVRVHWRMLRWGIAHRSPREVTGQILRIIGAATKTVFGMVPTGNTGGANVSAIRPLPLPSDLEAILRRARGGPANSRR